ncbi:hypothetical protein F441_18191 [Phytophthora nicotianae CJ01A1]|uniref:Uncharacterized protein n=6 Tax=Phytophthora nicotianae TaxID=4792 RepID=W2PLZ1_PHYN3|nr:hypothetical protein PPTG_24022 [Phytophthora nicotianae INRA-310]ETI35341.1 hypothetical protein F443_18316 [Phytophthora nicotianae P1569]ETK75594.1 hypothetical protein L915_17830 [Phytophthora nicotianae]ETO64082.1 hypothetical protein F444_18338 [Phytophthora nicotianae P1976]ETP05165.1 hypothetical protein F441_18191 [Phytophthora nicotianae CJ01A1]ETP33314.1 hypothetical protein F442_18145 [Phytophthora nicotianae P10297]
MPLTQGTTSLPERTLVLRWKEQPNSAAVVNVSFKLTAQRRIVQRSEIAGDRCAPHPRQRLRGQHCLTETWRQILDGDSIA